MHFNLSEQHGWSWEFSTLIGIEISPIPQLLHTFPDETLQSWIRLTPDKKIGPFQLPAMAT